MCTVLLPSGVNPIAVNRYINISLLIVLFCVLFVCKCLLYYFHRVSTQLQLPNISLSIQFVNFAVLCTVLCKCVLYYCHRVSTPVKKYININIINLYAFFLSPKLSTCPTYLIVLDLFNWIIFGKEWRP